MRLFHITLLLLILFPACGADDSLQEEIVGSWDMLQVLRDGEHTGALPGRFVRGPGARGD